MKSLEERLLVLIDTNKKVSSSGSLIAVLNLTIDRAPTKPKDKANDDLTTVIISRVVKSKMGKLFPNSTLSLIAFEYLMYKDLKK